MFGASFLHAAAPVTANPSINTNHERNRKESKESKE